MRVPVPDEILPAERLGRVHLVGLGGAGLSGIARILLARDVLVSGSDQAGSPVLDALAALGATVFVGHRADHVHGADTVVVSTAVREDNPEVVEAQRLGLRLLPRSAALQAVMVGRRVVAVAGTHGKTTTTSMLTVGLQHAGADPSYAIGGELTATGTNAGQGSGDVFVAEADESDGAFLVYTPHAAVVTNVDADHLDTWGTEAAYRAAFTAFLERIDPDGFLVVVADDPGAAALGGQARARGLRVVGVGEGPAASLQLRDAVLDGAGSRATVVRRAPGAEPEVLGELRLQVTGRHYLLDAVAALAAGLELGLPWPALRDGLASYAGTRRRMERKGEAGGVRVYDSYAHHPHEIRGDLQSARALAGNGRVVVCFQPHLVSRTRIFGADMGRELGAADEVVVLDVYLAREEPEPGVDGALVASHVPLPPERVRFEPDRARAAAALAACARPGDLVLTLGAGDVTGVGPEVLALLGAG